MIRTALFIAILLLATESAARPGTIHAGKVVRIIDGDTLVLATGRGERRIRIFGIDAPEIDTPEGPDSRETLRRVIAGRPLACAEITHDRYGRIVAICHAAKTDIAARMVALGAAGPYKNTQPFYR